MAIREPLPSATLTQGVDGSLYGTASYGGLGIYGTIYRVDISGALQITAQPAGQTVYAGNSASFNVATFGSCPVAYQWQLNGTNLADGGSISGATARVLTIGNATVAVAGTYSVIVSNSIDSLASSNATLTVIDSAPVITIQPANAAVFEGSTAAFSVQAQGDGPFAYQWQMNGSNFVQWRSYFRLSNRHLDHHRNHHQ